MKRFFQKLTVGIVLRVVHAALVELQAQDTRVAEEFACMPEGLSYSIYTGHNGPVLHVAWQGGKLRRLRTLDKATCTLQIKFLNL